MELIEKLDSKEFENLAAMQVGEERKYIYTETNFNNARRFGQELNRIGKITKKRMKYSVSAIAKELGFFTIIKIK